MTITVDCANAPSAAIPERLGFAKAGYLGDFWRSERGTRDAVQYALSRDAWRERACRPGLDGAS